MNTIKELITNLGQALRFTAYSVLAGFGFTIGVKLALSHLS